jgi:hypothetical protein
MQRTLTAGIIIALCMTGSAGATDINISPDITIGELEELAEHLAEAIDPPAGPAKHLGVTGFDLQVGVFMIDADEGSSWWRSSMPGYDGFLGTGLGGYRASALKGLPKGIDIGGQVGSVAGADFWSAEVRAAILKGGAATPALGLRLSWSTLAEGPLDLDVVTAQAMISKGFVILTPYAAAGYRQVSAKATWLEPFAPISYDIDSNCFVANAGLHISLPPIAIRVEARRGTTTSAFVSAGIRF